MYLCEVVKTTGNKETDAIPTQAESTVFQNIFNKIEAMDKIEGVEVPSDSWPTTTTGAG